MSKYIILELTDDQSLYLISILQKIDGKTDLTRANSFPRVNEILTNQTPDLILISIDSKISSVFEFCKQLKADQKFSHIPILLISGDKNLPPSGVEILDSGVDGFFTFPFDELAFQLQVRTLIKMGQLQKNTAAKKISEVSPSNDHLLKQEDLPSERKLSEAEAKFRLFIQNSTEGIIICNSDGLIIEMNTCLEEITGLKKKIWLGKPIWDFQTKISASGKKDISHNYLLKEFIVQILKDRESDAFGRLTESQIKRIDGQTRYIETNLYPIFNNGDFYIVSLIRDITNRKFFENALKNSESKYHGIFHANKDGISISMIHTDHSISNFTEANKAAFQMLGYSEEEYLSLNFNDLEVIDENIPVHRIISEIKKNKNVNFETKFKHKDGRILTVDINLIPIQYHHQSAVLSIVHDITEKKKITEELSKSEQLYRNLVERLPDGIYKSTHSGQFIEVNPAMIDMLGYDSKEELMNLDITNELYFTPEDRESVTLQEKFEEMGIFRLKKKDGSEIWVEDHGWYTLDENGEICFHEGIMRDISERKIAEELLKESEERFKLLFEKAPIGYQSLDENGNFIDINETWIEILGYQKEEVIGTNFGDYLTPEHLVLFHKRFPRFKLTGETDSEFEMIRKNGEIITIKLEGRIGHTASGTFKQTHCVLSDITEKRKAERAIAEEKILLRTLVDNIPDCIYVKDTAGRKILSNKADLEILGLTHENEILGKTDLELPYQGDASQTLADDLFVVNNSMPILNKLEKFTDLHGVERYFLTSKIPLINDSGKVTGLVGIGHDITQQKLSEQKIYLLSKGIDQSPASIIITNTLGDIEYANPKVTEITGYTFDELKGKNPQIFKSGFTSQEEYEKLWTTITSGNEYRSEIQNRKKNGDLYWESVLIFPIRDEFSRIVNFMAIKEDITNRKKSDLEILKLSVAIEQTPTSVVITDTQGVIEYVNKKFTSVSGYSFEELLGKTIRILKPGHTSEDNYVEIWNCLLAGNEWRGEHLNRTKDMKMYWESVLISPIKDQEGKINNYIVLSENISDRKKMEEDLVAAKEKAEESDRLKSAFLANMSHEIRTPLNSILGFSDLLTDPELDLNSRQEFSTLINSSGNNLLSIINDVLDISRIEAGQVVLIKSEFSAPTLIADIQKEYSFKAKSKGLQLIQAETSSTTEIIILSDEHRIKQVLINFVGNALKFTESGFIEIGVQIANEMVLFHVKDTGIGIEKEFHSKIFDRFRQIEASQTRKYGGNGLGLAITKNLAELLGGKIWLESEPGLGSTFYFSLPASLIVK